MRSLTLTAGVDGKPETKLEKWKKLKLLYSKNLQECIAIRQILGVRESYDLICNPGVPRGKNAMEYRKYSMEYVDKWSHSSWLNTSFSNEKVEVN